MATKKPNPLDAFVQGTSASAFKLRPMPRMADYMQQGVSLMDGFAQHADAMQQWADELVATVQTKLQPQAAATPLGSGTTAQAQAKTPAAVPKIIVGPTPTPTLPTTNLHGDGPPAANLGTPGSTYVDNLTGGLYWKSVTGWKP